MRFNSTLIVVNPAPGGAETGFMARALISTKRPDGTMHDIHRSGDLGVFSARRDAVAFATRWAQAWLEARFG